MPEFTYRLLCSLLWAATGSVAGLFLSFLLCFGLSIAMSRDSGAAIAMVWGMLIGPASAVSCGVAGFVNGLKQSKRE